MSRILTTRNPTHPHNQLNNFLSAMRAEYRKKSSAELVQIVSMTFSILAKKAGAGDAKDLAPTFPKHRHQQIDFMIEFHKDKFKKEWEVKFGYPFEDIYDQGKMEVHQCEEHVRNLAKAKEPLITEAMLDEGRAAASNSKRELHQFEHMVQLLHVMKAGLAGVTKDGIIIDRRRRNVFTLPLPKSEMLGTPEPVEITEDMRKQFTTELEAKAQAEAEAIPPFDMEKIADENGKEYTREEFDKLPEDERQDIKAYRGHMIQLITKAGYAGMLPGGKLVDRRVKPEAIPVQKNQMFGAPEPKEVPAALREVGEVMHAVAEQFGGKPVNA
jgi:hypothetical protein